MNEDAERPVALVTGASRGIGKAAALDLAAAGYHVAVAARTAVDGTARADAHAIPGGLDTTVAQIEQQGVRGAALVMDLLDRNAVLAAVDATLERFGRVDVLVNNAIYQGSGVMAPFDELDEGDLHRLFEGNVFAQLALIRAALPHLRGGGTIVNLISGAGMRRPPAKVGNGGWSVGYAMTKAAFGRVAPVLHVEYPQVRLFSVDPGLTLTERMVAAGNAAQYTANFRPGTPDVIGRCIRWLVTEPAESDDLRGGVVLAQEVVAERALQARWPAPRG
jgi:NAD(P)-dependent dehydrogenase (short-subunit alcohol dehydrogenase family)